MIVIPLEIRDRKTFISVLAIKCVAATEVELFHFQRNGFGPDGAGEIILLRLNDFAAHYDPYHWDQRLGRTMHEAHKWIRAHFAELSAGDVVDVEFILGEKPEPKVSERLARFG